MARVNPHDCHPARGQVNAGVRVAGQTGQGGPAAICSSRRSVKVFRAQWKDLGSPRSVEIRTSTRERFGIETFYGGQAVTSQNV